MLNTTIWCHVYRLTRAQLSYCICRYSSKMSTEMLELPSKPVVAVCQLTCTASKVKNYETCSALIRKAKSKGAQMVFLPEAVDYIGESKQQSLDLAEALDGDTITKYTNLAQELGVWLSVGGFHQKSNKKEDGRVYNTHVIIDSQGQVKSTYSKTHLFDLDIKGKVRLCESDYTIPGEKFVPPVSTPVGRVGMTICYDLRFPEYSLALAQQGAEILTYPSAFTVTTGLAHWEVLLRARAIETQCYVIAAAQTGKHNDKRSSYGHTMIIDPWGTVVSQCKEGMDVCVAEIDLEYLRKVRTEMPVSLHRRHDIYGHINVQTPAGDIDADMDYQFGQYTVKNSQVFYRSALSYAIVNIKPVLPGHVLVSPLRCAKRFSDLTLAEVTDLFSVVQKVSEVVERHFNGTSLTMAVQDGPDAGQSVEHVHVHILPRKPGDFPDNDDIYKVLQDHDKDMKKSDLRSEEEMAKEASILRQYFS